ncbi:zinc finger CCCH domain-containing protein 55 isoform X2 [Brassica napus]|uniref:zinc finger CCCH domain-containing protein 55 isoform X2 n=1 Tax=Brassica napus TaxID=3708 RepID=UPI0006AB209A|nr:zinc finger CCCH domain-containing protein 55 isoform X2 [Brassica napus]
MDSGDPTALLLTKIRSLEPDYATKIIGYLLLQDFSEKALMHLALGPESVLHSIISKVKTQLGLLSNNLSAPSTPPSPYPISRPPINGRGVGGGGLSHSNGFMGFRRNSPSSPSSTSPWSINGDSATDLLDDQQLNDCLSFLDDSCEKTEDVADPIDNGETHLHRRSFSADNVDGNDIATDSPRKVEDFMRQEEMMRLKMAYQRQRLASSQILNRAQQFPCEKRTDFLLHQHAHRDGGLRIGDERYWSSSPGRLERMELMATHFNDLSNSVARQIYLTFPAESTFKDEDVAAYFSLFGTVQDVRIPYQQKRMFGFVSFAHPETVKVVLARGNPHFICDSRVLVKPYKEKGKALDKKHHHLLQQQIELGNYSPCSSPSGLDPREQSDFQLDSKMFYQRREMMRRKMEQADLERAIEFERRRLINLQLPEFKNSVVLNHHRSFSVGSPGCFPSASNLSPDIQSELNSDAFEVDDATVVHSYPVTGPRRINHDKDSNGAKVRNNESEPDIGSTIELVFPSNLFPSATATDDSSDTSAKDGVSVSSGNGNDHEPPATTSSLMQ